MTTKLMDFYISKLVINLPEQLCDGPTDRKTRCDQEGSAADAAPGTRQTVLQRAVCDDADRTRERTFL